MTLVQQSYYNFANIVQNLQVIAPNLTPCNLQRMAIAQFGRAIISQHLWVK